MSAFGGYSQYYDLLYREKDYASEARYVDGLIKARAPHAKSVLEFGCGTGRYTREFARMGYRVHGVDLSDTMLEEASRTPCEGAVFSQGDMRALRLPEKFDVVTALFHVLSYQTTDDDVKNAMATVREHLLPAGVAVLDFWYGPAVLTQKPEVRFKEVSDDKIEVSRIALPAMRVRENVVDVNYRAFIKDKSTGVIEELRECHSMRYFFDGEIKRFASGAGLTVLSMNAWMADAPPDADSWAAAAVFR